MVTCYQNDKIPQIPNVFFIKIKKPKCPMTFGVHLAPKNVTKYIWGHFLVTHVKIFPRPCYAIKLAFVPSNCNTWVHETNWDIFYPKYSNDYIGEETIFLGKWNEISCNYLSYF